jgi:lipopolysaccharide/colanic/teichoic acid biosynthesis glycosyltransferase
MSRILSLVIAVPATLLALPFGVVIAVLILLEDRGPVFFFQQRIGRDGVPFRVFKFRTMSVGAQDKGLGLNISRGDDRITRVGYWLRRFSVDELPQLLNVLRGDMNVIGPRPALPFQVEKFTPFQRRRLLVRPGLTGWAQVNGRNALSWTERIEADVWYVDHRSLALDFRILWRTPAVVLSSEGLYEKDAGVGDVMNCQDTDVGRNGDSR